MPAHFIFTMRDLRRVHPPDKEVLRGINISMFPGAKIGVLGANGSGKSSLLRIMAGEDDGYTGEARLTSGFSVGFLSQEPRLDPAKDVMGNVAEGVGEAAALLDRYNKVCEAMGDPDADFDKLLAEQAELNDRIEAAGACLWASPSPWQATTTSQGPQEWGPARATSSTRWAPPRRCSGSPPAPRTCDGHWSCGPPSRWPPGGGPGWSWRARRGRGSCSTP